MLQGDVNGLIEAMSSLLPNIDKEALAGPEMGQYLFDSFQEGLKTSADGWVDDTLSSLQPWGFELREIQVPVLLYQGSEDKMVPYAHGEWFAKYLPQEKLRNHLIQGQGHISIFLGREESMLDQLLEMKNL
jgi:pimeloyl-ACP methyl ester carboxylesterase